MPARGRKKIMNTNQTLPPSGLASPSCSPSFYTASKTSHAPKWRQLRARGHNIIATWIDEADEGQSADYADLAERCIVEAAAADVTILYCQPGEILKGALLEVGAALAAGKEVRCVGDCESISRVFRKHPRWIECKSLDASLANVQSIRAARDSEN